MYARCGLAIGLVCSLATFVGPADLVGQRLERWELGVQLAGVAVLDGDVVLQLPGASFQDKELIDAGRQGFGGSPVAYARYFPSTAFYLEPEIGFRRFWGAGFSTHVLFLGTGFGYRLTLGSGGPSLYGSLGGGFLWTDNDQRTDKDFASTVGGGLWIPLLDRRVALALDSRLRAWRSNGREFTISVRSSVLLGDRQR